jgi:phosphatidylglycerophosphatase C
MNLALFDFDGTITVKDTFTDFFFFAINRKRLIFGTIFLLPILLCYKLRVLSPSITREIVAGIAFNGRKMADIQAIGMEYSNNVIPQYIRPEALKKIQWHKSRGDKIVVVSASIDVYLKGWCDNSGVELICTSFEVKNGLITGKYFRGDCSGKEKAIRILNNYNIKDYQIIYAYGDTPEDKEMLELADVKYYQWKQIDNYN